MLWSLRRQRLKMYLEILLSGKTNNVVKDGLNQRSPAHSGKVKPNKHIAQGTRSGCTD